jgi:IS1 family transposase
VGGRVPTEHRLVLEDSVFILLHSGKPGLPEKRKSKLNISRLTERIPVINNSPHRESFRRHSAFDPLHFAWWYFIGEKPRNKFGRSWSHQAGTGGYIGLGQGIGEVFWYWHGDDIESCLERNIVSGGIPVVPNNRSNFKNVIGVLIEPPIQKNGQIWPALQFDSKLLCRCNPLTDCHANSDGLCIGCHGFGNSFHSFSGLRCFSNRRFYILRLLGTGSSSVGKLVLHCIGLPFYQVSLSFNLTESPYGGYSSTEANDNQSERSVGCPFDSQERPPLGFQHTFFLCSIICGFLLALFMTLRIDNEWSRWRPYLVITGLAIAIGGCIAAAAWLTFPFTWGLPPNWLPEKWNPCAQGKPDQTVPHELNVSQKVLTSFYFPYYTKYMANVLSTDKQIAIIGSLCEGSSIRSIERMTGVHRDTIMRLGVRVGEGCTKLMDSEMRNLDCTRLEMDDIWGFVGAKAKNVKLSHFDNGGYAGDVWTFCAIDADTKLVPAFMVGQRDKETAKAFVYDIAKRMNNRLQISTDGLSAYVDAIASAFGRDVDFAQIIKTYGSVETTNNRRYSAPDFVSSETHVVIGNPDKDLISTSYVERLNATTRLHMRRLTRLTLAFSKRVENFEAACGLHFAYYNFVLRHTTLKTTPAVAAGVASQQWTVGELLEQAA